MNRKLVGAIVAAGGVALLVLSALADPLSVGNENGFGWKQVTGVVVGIAAAIAGLALMYVRRGGAEAPAEEKRGP